MSPTTVFPVYAEADAPFARQLAVFLESGCDVSCRIDDGMVESREEWLDKAEEGLAEPVLLLLLSAESSPDHWDRNQWEPVLFERAREEKVDVATVLVGECPFPQLLRRRNFFDASVNPLHAMRSLKRWIWQRGTGEMPARIFSGDLEFLYEKIADQAGTAEVSGEVAVRFAEEAASEFQAVLWASGHGRSLAQIAGEIGVQLGLALEEPPEENCRRIRDFISGRRFLLVLDAPARELVGAFVPCGRSSLLITLDPVKVVETSDSLSQGRILVSSRRYAEAYEMLYRLLNAGISGEAAAHELKWICILWGRYEEADSLDNRFRKPGEQYRFSFPQ